VLKLLESSCFRYYICCNLYLAPARAGEVLFLIACVCNFVCGFVSYVTATWLQPISCRHELFRTDGQWLENTPLHSLEHPAVGRRRHLLCFATVICLRVPEYCRNIVKISTSFIKIQYTINTEIVEVHSAVQMGGILAIPIIVNTEWQYNLLSPFFDTAYIPGVHRKVNPLMGTLEPQSNGPLYNVWEKWDSCNLE